MACRGHGRGDGVFRALQGGVQRIGRAAAVEAAPAKGTHGSLVDQTLERPLRPGEVSLDELERAFRETAIEAVTVNHQPWHPAFEPPYVIAIVALAVAIMAVGGG